jgi:hypothetical protein
MLSVAILIDLLDEEKQKFLASQKDERASDRASADFISAFWGKEY